MKKGEEYIPIEMPDYIPKVVQRLLSRMRAEAFATVALYGFSDNMKWLYRLLREQGRDPVLCDWRADFIAYDCGGKDLVSIDTLRQLPGTRQFVPSGGLAIQPGCIAIDDSSDVPAIVRFFWVEPRPTQRRSRKRPSPIL